MLFVELDFSFLLVTDKRPALCGSTTCRIRDGQECEDRSKNDGGVPRALGFPNGVLARFCLVVSDGRHNQICAIDGDHACLDETRSGVVLLNGRVNAHDRDDDA